MTFICTDHIVVQAHFNSILNGKCRFNQTIIRWQIDTQFAYELEIRLSNDQGWQRTDMTKENKKKAATAGRSGKNCMHKTNTVELI